MEKVIKTWVVKETAQEVAVTVCESIIQLAKRTIQEKGVFRIVLAGGTTPELVYCLLANEPCDWRNWHLYLGDERYLAIEDPERNSQMIQRTLLDKIEISQENIHLIPAEIGTKEAALVYDSVIKKVIPFDVVLLGMGEDGHTASLFPEHTHGDELVHAIHDAPKPPSDRVSLSVKALSSNQSLIIMVTGLSKQKVVQKWRSGEGFPVNQITSLGKIDIVLDEDAFS